MIDVVILNCQFGHASTFIAPAEVFTSAGVMWNTLQGKPAAPRFRVKTVSVDGKPVRSDAGTTVVPDGSIAEVAKADIIFVPTAGNELDRLIELNRKSLDWMQAFHQRGTMIAGVCTGVGLIAEAGLLDGRRGTTHWAAADHFRTRYPKVEWHAELAVTEDRGILCSGGVYSSLDLALYIVEKECGREVAVEVAKAMVLQMPRTFQIDFAVLPLGRNHGDAAIRRAEDWLYAHYAKDVDIDALASELGLTTRTFLRRFKAATGETPLAYHQHLRVEAAKRLIEKERLTIQEVSLAVGYEDVGFFRDVFKRRVHLSPRAYREQFGQPAERAAAE